MPDNSVYYRAAYCTVALLYAGYALALWMRGRRAITRWRADARQSTDAPPHPRP